MSKKVLCLLFTFSILLSACAQKPGNSPTIADTQSPLTFQVNDDWGNYEIYESGLISSEQYVLDSLSTASIYHINIQIADNMLSLFGHEKVHYSNQENLPLNEVYFQLFPNMEGGSSTITASSVDNVAVNPIYEDENTTLRIPLITPLEPGRSIDIDLDFSVTLPEDAGGNYGLFGYIDNILVLDGFYPAIPVYDSNGWHKGRIPPNSDTTFQDVSFYRVTVTAPAKLVLVASGTQIASAKKGNQQIVTFAQGPSRDFYIAASKEFKITSETIGETTVNSYTTKRYDHGSQLALTIAVNTIKAYNERIGTYPYTEFDIVSTPMQGAYGIEYPGIVGINYSLYDIDSTTGGNPTYEILESTVAHETGHQWFYSVVGDDQINEPWLDESMTQYTTILYYLAEYGNAGFTNFENTWYSRWDRVKQKAIPIGLPAGSYSGKEYSAIVYGRGPIFVDKLSDTMGQEQFSQFLKDYYEQNKWGISTTASYKQLAEVECQCDLTQLFTDWVYAK